MPEEAFGCRRPSGMNFRIPVFDRCELPSSLWRFDCFRALMMFGPIGRRISCIVSEVSSVLESTLLRRRCFGLLSVTSFLETAGGSVVLRGLRKNSVKSVIGVSGEMPVIEVVSL